jgi:hypothetical protein
MSKILWIYRYPLKNLNITTLGFYCNPNEHAYYTIKTADTNINQNHFSKHGEFNFKVELSVEKAPFLISHAKYDEHCTSNL